MPPETSPVRRIAERLWAGRHLPQSRALAEFPPQEWRAKLLQAALDHIRARAACGKPYDPGYDDLFAWSWARITQISSGEAPNSDLTFRCGWALDGYPTSFKDAAAGETQPLAQGS